MLTVLFVVLVWQSWIGGPPGIGHPPTWLHSSFCGFPSSSSFFAAPGHLGDDGYASGLAHDRVWVSVHTRFRFLTTLCSLEQVLLYYFY